MTGIFETQRAQLEVHNPPHGTLVHALQNIPMVDVKEFNFRVRLKSGLEIGSDAELDYPSGDMSAHSIPLAVHFIYDFQRKEFGLDRKVEVIRPESVSPERIEDYMLGRLAIHLGTVHDLTFQLDTFGDVEARYRGVQNFTLRTFPRLSKAGYNINEFELVFTQDPVGRKPDSYLSLRPEVSSMGGEIIRKIRLDMSNRMPEDERRVVTRWFKQHFEGEII